MSLAAFPWRDRPLGRVASEVWRVIDEHGAPCSIYAGNVFIRVCAEQDHTDPQYVGPLGPYDTVDIIMNKLDDALRDLRGSR